MRRALLYVAVGVVIGWLVPTFFLVMALGVAGAVWVLTAKVLPVKPGYERPFLEYRDPPEYPNRTRLK